MRVRAGAAAAIVATACSVGSTGDGGGFASVGGTWPSSASVGEASSDGDASDDAASDAEASDDAASAADTSDDAASDADEGGDASTGGAASSPEDGDDSSTGDVPPELGPVCGGGGAIALPGAIGPASASQYCPQTDFVVQIDGAPGAIADVDVSIDGVLANTSQNRLWLIGPSGTQVLLFDHRGTFLTDDFVGTLFDSDAPTLVASAPGPFHGCFAPEQSLASFVGQQADGTWILRVETCLYETSIGAWQLHLDF